MADARRPTVVLLLALLLGGCVPVRSDDDTAREAELAIRSLMAAWENGDAALVEDLFWPQATYDDFANQQTYEGLQEIVEYVTAVHQWADDVYWNVGAVHLTENGAVAEWVFSAVQARPVSDQIPMATGRDVVTNGVTIIEMDGERIMRAADYMDTAPLLLQMGARIEMPGGGVIEIPDSR